MSTNLTDFACKVSRITALVAGFLDAQDDPRPDRKQKGTAAIIHELGGAYGALNADDCGLLGNLVSGRGDDLLRAVRAVLKDAGISPSGEYRTSAHQTLHTSVLLDLHKACVALGHSSETE